MRVTLFFIDGLGLGADDPEVNPLARLELPAFRSMLNGRGLTGTESFSAPGVRLFATDALLGVDGVPQSATGQTSLLTGINAQAELGFHLNGFPNPRLRSILMRDSALKQAVEQGFEAEFVNAFTPIYWRALEAGAPCQSATTLSMVATGRRLRTTEDLAAGRSVYQDITNRLLVKRGIFPELYEPERAGRNLARAAGELDLALYEYFLTDHYAHKGDAARVERSLTEIDRFLAAFLEHKPDDMSLIIASDHGNLEDLSFNDHTFNPTPTLVYGPAADRLAGPIERLTDIAPAIIDLLRT